MTKKELAEIKVGSILENVLGDLEVVVRIEGLFTILKYIHEDGTLSAGEDWCVDTHLLDGYKLITTI